MLDDPLPYVRLDREPITSALSFTRIGRTALT